MVWEGIGGDGKTGPRAGLGGVWALFWIGPALWRALARCLWDQPAMIVKSDSSSPVVLAKRIVASAVPFESPSK